MYVLEGHTPVPCADPVAWALWFGNADGQRRVNYTRFSGGCTVSTVFIGLEYNFHGPPLLFETLVFKSRIKESRALSSSWEEAEYQHVVMCGRVLRVLLED